MREPVFLHVCVNWRTRDALIYQHWMFMQHYPEAKRFQERKAIIIPGVMAHIYRPSYFEIQSLYGIKLKGFDVEYGAELSLAQVEFLRSRVRV